MRSRKKLSKIGTLAVVISILISVLNMKTVLNHLEKAGYRKKLDVWVLREKFNESNFFGDASKIKRAWCIHYIVLTLHHQSATTCFGLYRILLMVLKVDFQRGFKNGRHLLHLKCKEKFYFTFHAETRNYFLLNPVVPIINTTVPISILFFEKSIFIHMETLWRFWRLDWR